MDNPSAKTLPTPAWEVNPLPRYGGIIVDEKGSFERVLQRITAIDGEAPDLLPAAETVLLPNAATVLTAEVRRQLRRNLWRFTMGSRRQRKREINALLRGDRDQIVRFMAKLSHRVVVTLHASPGRQALNR